MAEDQLLDDFDTYIAKVNEVKSFLTRLYYDPEFSNLFNREAIGLLITGCNFLITNLRKFRKTRETSLG